MLQNWVFVVFVQELTLHIRISLATAKSAAAPKKEILDPTMRSLFGLLSIHIKYVWIRVAKHCDLSNTQMHSFNLPTAFVGRISPIYLLIRPRTLAFFWFVLNRQNLSLKLILFSEHSTIFKFVLKLMLIIPKLPTILKPSFVPRVLWYLRPRFG